MSIAGLLLCAGVILFLCGVGKRPSPGQAVPGPSDPRYIDIEFERRAAGNYLILGSITAGLGATLLLACGRNDSEKKGYRF